MNKAICLLVGLVAVATIVAPVAGAAPVETCVDLPAKVGTINLAGQRIPGVSNVSVCVKSATGATGEPQVRRYEGCGEACLAVVIRDLAVAVDATVSVAYSLDGKAQEPIPVTTGATTITPLDGSHNCVFSYHDPGTPNPCENGISTPANLRASGSKGKVTLQWNRSFAFGESSVAGYEIWRSTTGAEGTFAPMTSVTSTSFTDLSVAKNTTYYYSVVAFDNQGVRSGWSNPASATAR